MPSQLPSSRPAKAVCGPFNPSRIRFIYSVRCMFSGKMPIPLAAAIAKAYADCRKIVFETDIAAMQEPAMQAKMLQLGLYPQGQNLLPNLDGRTRQLLARKMTELGLPLEQFVRFKPWFLALTLTTVELQRLGFNPIYGLDLHFFNKARTDAKEIGFLEPVELQLNLLANMVKKDQNAFLNQTLKDLEVVNELAADLVKFWKAGNADGLHQLLFKSFKDYPAIHDRLLIQRNKKWVKEIEAQMRGKQKCSFCFGRRPFGGTGKRRRSVKA